MNTVSYDVFIAWKGAKHGGKMSIVSSDVHVVADFK